MSKSAPSLKHLLPATIARGAERAGARTVPERTSPEGPGQRAPPVLDASDSLEERQPVAPVQLEVITYGPLVPSVDEYQTVARCALGDCLAAAKSRSNTAATKSMSRVVFPNSHLSLLVHWAAKALKHFGRSMRDRVLGLIGGKG